MSTSVSDTYDPEHDPLCPFHVLSQKPTGIAMSSCQCDLIARVREDARDCHNHNYRVKDTCQHYYLGYKNGYTTTLQSVGEMVGWSLGKCNHLGEISDGTSTAAVLKKLNDFIDNLGSKL